MDDATLTARLPARGGRAFRLLAWLWDMPSSRPRPRQFPEGDADAG